MLQKRNRKLCKKHFSCFRVCVGSAAWPPTVKGSVSGVGFAWQVSPKGDSWLSFTTFLTNSATPFIWTPSGGAGGFFKREGTTKRKNLEQHFGIRAKAAGHPGPQFLETFKRGPPPSCPILPKVHLGGFRARRIALVVQMFAECQLHYVAGVPIQH